MPLTRTDVIDALKLRAFALKFNLTQSMHPSKRRIASEELQAIEDRLFAENCLDIAAGTLKAISAKGNHERSSRTLSHCR